MTDTPVDVLVVEDKKFERESIINTLKSVDSALNVVSIEDGAEAIDFLLGQGIWKQRDTSNIPQLIILDLGLPNVDGLTILKKIRSLEPSEPLTTTPVVIFSDSENPQKLSESYRLGANSYTVKPVLFSEFSDVVEKIGDYWINYNQLP